MEVSVKQLQKGDRFVSADGRGIERVTFNRRSGRAGHRFIRTSRTDHNWPSDKRIEVERG